MYISTLYHPTTNQYTIISYIHRATHTLTHTLEIQNFRLIKQNYLKPTIISGVQISRLSLCVRMCVCVRVHVIKTFHHQSEVQVGLFVSNEAFMNKIYHLKLSFILVHRMVIDELWLHPFENKIEKASFVTHI